MDLFSVRDSSCREQVGMKQFFLNSAISVNFSMWNGGHTTTVEASVAYFSRIPSENNLLTTVNQCVTHKLMNELSSSANASDDSLHGSVPNPEVWPTNICGWHTLKPHSKSSFSSAQLTLGHQAVRYFSQHTHCMRCGALKQMYLSQKR